MQRSAEKQKLITDNLGLAYKVAADFVRKGFFKPEEMEDLAQDAMIGLIRAADGFNKKRNIKFSTFAYKSIKNYLLLIIKERETDKRKANKDALSLDQEIRSTRSKEKSETIGELIPSKRSTDETALEIRLEDVKKLMECDGVKEKRIEWAMRMLQGESGQEIATDEKTDRQTVHQNVKKAYAKIKNELWQICREERQREN